MLRGDHLTGQRHQIAAIYLMRFVGLDSLAQNQIAQVGLGSFFIVTMTVISARGIVVSKRLQTVLIIQLGVLVVVSSSR